MVEYFLTAASSIFFPFSAICSHSTAGSYKNSVMHGCDYCNDGRGDRLPVAAAAVAAAVAHVGINSLE